MEVPSGVAGGVKELRVKLGDSVSEGDVIAVLEAEGEAAAKPASKVEQPATQKPEPAVPASKPSSAPSAAAGSGRKADIERSEEHTSELQSLMRNSYAVFCLKKKNKTSKHNHNYDNITQQQTTKQHT